MDKSQDNDPGMDILRHDAQKICENAGLSIEDYEIDAMTRIINKNPIREFEYEKKVAKALKKQSTVVLKEEGVNSTPINTENEEGAAKILPKGDANADGAAKQPNEEANKKA